VRTYAVNHGRRQNFCYVGARYVTNDEVFRRTGLLPASSIVRTRRLGLFGHVARLAALPIPEIIAIEVLGGGCEPQI